MTARKKSSKAQRQAERIREAMAMKPVELAFGANHVRITVNGLETKNELNRREHWRIVSRRRREQMGRFDIALRMAGAQGMSFKLPARVTLARLGPGLLDPLCNLPSALKKAEDAVCEHFRVNDGPNCPVAFRCSQRKRRVPGVEIVLEWEAPGGDDGR